MGQQEDRVKAVRKLTAGGLGPWTISRLLGCPEAAVREIIAAPAQSDDTSH